MGSVIPFYLKRLNNHKKTLEHVRDVLKPLHRKKKLKFVMVSGIFSEKHSEAIQIINFQIIFLLINCYNTLTYHINRESCFTL